MVFLGWLFWVLMVLVIGKWFFLVGKILLMVLLKLFLRVFDKFVFVICDMGLFCWFIVLFIKFLVIFIFFGRVIIWNWLVLLVGKEVYWFVLLIIVGICRILGRLRLK